MCWKMCPDYKLADLFSIFIYFTFEAYTAVRRMFLTKYLGQHSRGNPVYPE